MCIKKDNPNPNHFKWGGCVVSFCCFTQWSGCPCRQENGMMVRALMSYPVLYANVELRNWTKTIL